MLANRLGMKGMKMEIIAWKAKMFDLTRKVECLGPEERDKVMHNNQDRNIRINRMSSRIEPLKNESPAEWTPQKKDIDNGCVDMRGKYMRRSRFSWTGVYGKEPWPRRTTLWEKV
jgi:hypothetical protein